MLVSALLLTLRLTGAAELSSVRIAAPLLLAFSGTVDIPCCRARIASALLGEVYGSAAYKNYEGVCLPGVCGLGLFPMLVYVALVLGAIGLFETLPSTSAFYSNASVLLFVAGIFPGFPTVLSSMLLGVKYLAKLMVMIACCCPALRNGEEIRFWEVDDFEVVPGQWRGQVIWRLIFLQVLTVMVLMGAITVGTAVSSSSRSTAPGSPLHFLFSLCLAMAVWVALGAVVEMLMRCRRNTVLVLEDREGPFCKPGAPRGLLACTPAWAGVHGRAFA